MRSRYCAYALGRVEYLRDTWHPDTRPAQLDLAGPQWIGLTVTAVQGGGPEATTGEVTFIAHYLAEGQPGELCERSRFRREAGHWFYLGGDVDTRVQPKVGRNTPCPCGSGRKFKRCCGA